MKTITFTFSIFLSAFLLTSCEKTWQCKCTSYSNRPPGPITATGTSIITLKGKKKEMKGSCEEYGRSKSHSTGGLSCKLK
ncbi:MAG: hypothetical protein K9G49_02330 [Taibaiella sp.]|nr:hypothetical protein [Taibaiella sp.]